MSDEEDEYHDQNEDQEDKMGDNEGSPGSPQNESEAPWMGHRSLFEIFVKNLSDRTTNRDIQKLFERHGNVIQVVRFQIKEYCFVYMKHEEEGEEAVHSLNGHIHHGKTWVVESTGACNGYNPRKIVVRNLQFGIEHKHLKAALKDYGTILELTIHNDTRNTFKAFIVLADEEEAQRAIEEVNGMKVNGKSVSVSEASNRQVRRWLGRRRGDGRESKPLLPLPRPAIEMGGMPAYGPGYPPPARGHPLGTGYQDTGGMVWECARCGSTEGRLVNNPYSAGRSRFDPSPSPAPQFYPRQPMQSYREFDTSEGPLLPGKRKQPLLPTPPLLDYGSYRRPEPEPILPSMMVHSKHIGSSLQGGSLLGRGRWRSQSRHQNNMKT